MGRDLQGILRNPIKFRPAAAPFLISSNPLRGWISALGSRRLSGWALIQQRSAKFCILRFFMYQIAFLCSARCYSGAISTPSAAQGTILARTENLGAPMQR